MQLFEEPAPPDPPTHTSPRHLSPSSASLYEQCARRWRFRYLDRLPDPPGEAALAGSFAHRVLELLFRRAPDGRTVDEARRLARQVWPEVTRDGAYQALELDAAGARAFRWRAWQAIEGLWKLEEPSEVDVAATEHLVETRVGEVPFRGIVDRLDHRPGGVLEVTDYKSGRAPTARFEREALTQVLLYAAAMEASTGQRPRRARLVYLSQRVVEIDASDEELAAAVAGLEQTWSALRDDLATGEFAPRPGPLCGWCPFASRCPEGTAEIERRDSVGRQARRPATQELVARAG